MGLNAQLSPLTLPFGTEFPGTMQELLVLISQYEEIIGLENFNGINFGPTEPAPEDRDRPWFETDGSGNPIGWKAWTGIAWTAIPAQLPVGATGDRPVAPDEGTQFFDTTIEAALIYINGAWVTLSGVSGDIKFVAHLTLADALLYNPGWSHYTAGVGKVLAGAAADGSDAGDDVGANEITLTEAQLPSHTHEGLQGQVSDNINGGGPLSNGFMSGDTNTAGVDTWPNSVTGSTGDGDPVDIRQATKIVFCIQKD